jgi:hypothetical protein
VAEEADAPEAAAEAPEPALGTLPEALAVPTALTTAERPDSLSRLSRRRSDSRSAAVW